MFLLHCLSVKYAVSDHFRWSNVPARRNKLKSMAPIFETRFLWLVLLKSLKTVPSGSAMIEMNFKSVGKGKFWKKGTTGHLQLSRADKCRTFFKSEAFKFSSASLIEFIQLGPETLQHIERLLYKYYNLAGSDAEQRACFWPLGSNFILASTPSVTCRLHSCLTAALGMLWWGPPGTRMVKLRYCLTFAY